MSSVKSLTIGVLSLILSIMAFLSLVSIFPFKGFLAAIMALTGVILGIIGLKKSDKKISVAGIVIGGMYLVFLSILLIGYLIW